MVRFQRFSMLASALRSVAVAAVGVSVVLLVLVMTSCRPGAIVLPAPRSDPLLDGFVDMHAHPMAHLGFGGKLLHGAPDVGTLTPAIPSGGDCVRYQPAATIADALGSDRATHGGHDVFNNRCGDEIRKQVIWDMEGALGAQTRHEEQGALGHPTFNFWPAFNDITHQQMWVDWIRRAHEGGLNVIVALAVNNATLAAAVMGPGDINGDDVRSAEVQIEEMVAMVNRHSDFMEVALTPAALRDIVESGRLAVVLGIEIDNIGNLHKNPTVDPNNVTDQSRSRVTAWLQQLWNQGVRYVFPVHVVDNKFGGTAIYQNMFNLSNYHQTGRFWDIGCASPTSGITHQFVVDGFDVPFAAVKALKLGIDPFRNPPTPPSCSGHVNRLGITPLGGFAIRAMMRMGMMIDVDHMSELAVDATLDIAELYDYPVNSGHNGPRGSDGDENGRTDEDYGRIAELGGMVGLGHGGNISNFVRSYHYVFGLEGFENSMQIAIGTDANGLVPLPGPDADARVQYSTFFPRSSTGAKSWDIRTDGVAHYGLLSDFVRGWKTLSFNREFSYEKDFFFLSAEGFAAMWERVEVVKTNVDGS